MDQTVNFLTCGHVDDGKSTLIGRLLCEMGVIPEDQLHEATVNGTIDYSRLTDGLEDERAQGITIDVAYRYFRHKGVSFRIADTPGHTQYLHNMVVAALDSQCALLLVDATHGVRDQTIRHAQIASFFGMKRFVILVNKMDLVGYDRERFEEICAEFISTMKEDQATTFTCIPISAVQGDNVASLSSQTPWYHGPTLLDYLETFSMQTAPLQVQESAASFPVQSVIRTESTVRGYLGTVATGTLHVGDTLIVANTSGEIKQTVHVKTLYHGFENVQEVSAGTAAVVIIEEDADIARGSVLIGEKSREPYHFESLKAGVFWLKSGLKPEDVKDFEGMIKIHHQEDSVQFTPERIEGPIAIGDLSFAQSIVAKPFDENPRLGTFLLIDSGSETVAGIGKIL